MPRRPLLRSPLHRQVADQLRQDIVARHQPGERLPSEACLAAQFAVSLVTVREALSALAQEGLLERRHGSGTYVAARDHRRHVAIVSGMDLAGGSPPVFHLRVVDRLTTMLRAAGSAVRWYLGPTEPDPHPVRAAITSNGLLDAIAERRISGIVALANPRTSRIGERAAEAGIPLVGDHDGFPWFIDVDVDAMIGLGLRRLLANGRRRIAVQLWQDPHTGAGERTRIATVRAELAAAGAACRPEWIVPDLDPRRPGSGHHGFTRLWHAHADAPDGLLICDDRLLGEASMGILAQGIAVPETLSVVSCGLKAEERFSPFALTMLELDPELFADAAAMLLLQLMRGKTPVQRRIPIVPAFREVHAVSPPASRLVRTAADPEDRAP
jgi:GntR family transcriptional regulator, arabinose operon transcriptional repressor